MPLKNLRNSFRRKGKGIPPPPVTSSSSSSSDPSNWIKTSNASVSDSQREPRKEKKSGVVGDIAALWNRKVEKHQATQAANPFSGSYAGPQKLNKYDPNYGRPEENSLSARRAKDGEAKVRQEICDLCQTIFDFGIRSNDGRSTITFGKLFQIYSAINDKCVGLCIMARKRKLLTFEGEMLFQSRDDDKIIELTKTMNSILVYFGRTGDLPGGGDVDPEIIESRRRCDSVSSKNKTDQRRDEEESENDSKSHKRSLANSFRRMTRPLVERRRSMRNKKKEISEEESTEAKGKWNKVLGATVAMNRFRNTAESPK